MLGGDDLLDAVLHPGLIPGEQAEKLLRRSWGKTGLQRDRLDAFAVEVGELPPHVDRQVLSRAAVDETIHEPANESIKYRQQARQALSIHAESSQTQRVIQRFVDSAKAEKTSLAL
jgi:hypothetical protein